MWNIYVGRRNGESKRMSLCLHNCWSFLHSPGDWVGSLRVYANTEKVESHEFAMGLHVLNWVNNGKYARMSRPPLPHSFLSLMAVCFCRVKTKWEVRFVTKWWKSRPNWYLKEFVQQEDKKKKQHRIVMVTTVHNVPPYQLYFIFFF